VTRFVRRLARPLGDVMVAADRLADGDTSVRVDERGPRELRRLARSFNTMAGRLDSAEAERRRLLSDVTHELRTPLSVIQGGVEGVLDGMYPADAEHLGPVVEETKVMARLLDDLQTLSTAEAGALRLDRRPVAPTELVEDAVASFRPQADAAQVRLAARTDPGAPAVLADPLRIGQVLANLLSNALRHTPSGGTVTVSATPAAAGASFEVADTGPGIPDDEREHVFERFVKSPGSAGAGLGLAIARSLVRAHHGEIVAEPAPGGGTVIRFHLPAAD
jgi:signal transduction histidine kinase